MTDTTLPVRSFLAARGSAEIGQFYGLQFGSGITTQDQGGYLKLDAAPAPPPVVFPVSDAIFRVFAAADASKTFAASLAGQAAATQQTIASKGTASRTFRFPDISGTGINQEDATEFVYIGGQTTQDNGSGSGVQLQSPTSGRAAIRLAQYGNHAGIPGVSGFKSRAAAFPALGACVDGDVLWRATATGVTGNGLNIPIAGFCGFEIPVGGVFAASISPDFVWQLAKDTINSRRVVWTIKGFTGDLVMALPGARILLKEGANAMQGVATLGVGGIIVVPNTIVTATSRVILTIQPGVAPLGTIYVSAIAAGVSFTIQSNDIVDLCTVAWQIWEPAP